MVRKDVSSQEGTKFTKKKQSLVYFLTREQIEHKRIEKQLDQISQKCQQISRKCHPHFTQFMLVDSVHRASPLYLYAIKIQLNHNKFFENVR